MTRQVISGVMVNGEGYVLMKYMAYNKRVNKNGYIFEHVFNYEKHHGCCLLKHAAIHHKDGNRLNNSIGNLEGMMMREHSRLHHIGKPLSEQAKMKMSEYCKNRKLSDYHKQRISEGRLAKHIVPWNKGKRLEHRNDSQS